MRQVLRTEDCIQMHIPRLLHCQRGGAEYTHNPYVLIVLLGIQFYSEM
jgi:hypothetical protein